MILTFVFVSLPPQEYFSNWSLNCKFVARTMVLTSIHHRSSEKRCTRSPCNHQLLLDCNCSPVPPLEMKTEVVLFHWWTSHQLMMIMFLTRNFHRFQENSQMTRFVHLSHPCTDLFLQLWPMRLRWKTAAETLERFQLFPILLWCWIHVWLSF